VGYNTFVLWRAILAICVIWMGLIFCLVRWTEISHDSAVDTFWFAVAPLIVAFILRRVMRFVVSGR